MGIKYKMKTTAAVEIELRSDEVQEVLNHIPHALVRWGITLFLSIVILMMALTHVIHYPDVVEARVTLMTKNPPVHLMARTSGPIKLATGDNVYVRQHSLLGIILNPGKSEDILALSAWMDRIRESVYRQPIQMNAMERLAPSLTLGEVQSSYQSFCQAVDAAVRFEAIALFDTQRLALLTNVSNYDQLNRELIKQRRFMQLELTIAKIKYEDDSVLFGLNAISKREMFLSKTAFIQDERNLENINVAIIQNTIKSIELRSKASEVMLSKREELDKLTQQLIRTYEQLLVDVNSWKQKYLLISPISGKVTFSKFWSDNQFVKEHEEVLSVVPGKQYIIGKVELPITGSGKVKVGQRVKLKFENYPYSEYGMLIGHVASVSLVPVNNAYSLSIKLPQDLISTYRKKLVFKQEMNGVAEIITDDKRLSERILYQLLKLMEDA